MEKIDARVKGMHLILSGDEFFHWKVRASHDLSSKMSEIEVPKVEEASINVDVRWLARFFHKYLGNYSHEIVRFDVKMNLRDKSVFMWPHNACTKVENFFVLKPCMELIAQKEVLRTRCVAKLAVAHSAILTPHTQNLLFEQFDVINYSYMEIGWMIRALGPRDWPKTKLYRIHFWQTHVSGFFGISPLPGFRNNLFSICTSLTNYDNLELLWMTHMSTAMEVRKKLVLLENNEVSLLWVPGH